MKLYAKEILQNQTYFGLLGKRKEKIPVRVKRKIIVQFPMSPTKRKSIPVTTYFITLIGRPHCNGHFCWQASLLHLPAEF